METKQIADSRVGLLITLYDMHTTFYSNVIDGISDKDAHNRLNTKANHVAWITGSLVHERYEMANAAGVELQQTSNELFEGHKGIQDDAVYPSLSEFKSDWNKITPILRKTLLQLSEEE